MDWSSLQQVCSCREPTFCPGAPEGTPCPWGELCLLCEPVRGVKRFSVADFCMQTWIF